MFIVVCVKVIQNIEINYRYGFHVSVQEIKNVNGENYILFQMSVKNDLVFVFCKNLKSLAKCWITWFPGFSSLSFFPWLSSLRVCQSTVFAAGMKHSRNKLNLEDSTFWTHWKSWKILLALVPTDKGQMVGVRSLLGKLFSYAATLSMHQLHLFISPGWLGSPSSSS